ncbi:hypothetical protein [Streptomyces sp. NPDC001530]|uniref:hypothetical protein n=1 Tax=Streptomyces sp. NPDC001530 TaxID=3364582 RepID=UPI0036AD5EEE
MSDVVRLQGRRILRTPRPFADPVLGGARQTMALSSLFRVDLPEALDRIVLCTAALFFTLLPESTLNRVGHGFGQRVGLAQSQSLKEDPMPRASFRPRAEHSERK